MNTTAHLRTRCGCTRTMCIPDWPPKPVFVIGLQSADIFNLDFPEPIMMKIRTFELYSTIFETFEAFYLEKYE
jgi:hypothetical protein